MDFPLVDLGRILAQVVPAFVTQPSNLLVIAIVWWMYHRKAGLERSLFGVAKTDPWRQTLVSALLGVVGGAVGTAAFLLIGVSMTDVGALYLWPVALLLMMLRPRFMCFAYAGGLLSLSSLLFGFPRIDVASLMALVAILHIIEACLIWISGHLDASPIYLKRADGSVVGGFSLQSFWPIPFIALVGLAVGADVVSGQSVKMPDWWPLIRPVMEPGAGQQIAYFVVPMIAALGYGDFALTRLPAQKARMSAVNLALYSVVLLVLALWTGKGGLWPYLAAIFSPLGHELVIFLGRWAEERGRPLFTAERGCVVLDMLPDSPALAMGLRPGDRIRSVNGIPVESGDDLQASLEPWALEVRMVVESATPPGQERHLVYRGKVPPLGLLLAPQLGEHRFVELAQGSGIRRWLGTWWSRWRTAIVRN